MNLVEVGEEFIKHYGVKGQRWGVRRRRTTTGKDQKVIAKRKKIAQRRRTLSDTEIKTVIDRISNEKKLKTLVDEDVAPGKTAAKRILSDSGQKVARTVVAGAALYGIKAAMDKKFSLGDAASYIAPKPKR